MESNHQQAGPAAHYIARLLHARILEPSSEAVAVPDALSPEVFTELAQRNRLGATLFAAAAESDAWPVAAEEEAEWKREAYRRAVLQAQRLNQAVQLAAVLEARGIPCVCMRGPFAGQRLYGDVAWRPFADIDLLVPRKRAREAWSMAQTAGFELFQERMPLGYFLRHHLHWQLKHPVSGLLCDLHWAVEHPYRLYTIDYDAVFQRSRMVEADGLTWREPDPADHFLLLAMHLKKHMPQLYAVSQEDDQALQVFLHGEVFHILDLALILQRDASSLDGEQLLETARAWGCMDALAASLACVEQMFGLSLPGEILEQARAQVPAWQAEAARSGWSSGVPRWWAIAAFKGGFRTEKMTDAWAYLNPPVTYFGDRASPLRFARRQAHRVKAIGQLGFAGVDTAAALLIAQLRGKKGAVARAKRPMGIC